MTLNPEGLETRYQSLLSLNNKLAKIRILSLIPVFLMIGTLFSMTYIASAIGLDPKYAITIPLIFVIIVVFVLIRSNKYIMKKDDYLFFAFYDVYKKLKTFAYS